MSSIGVVGSESLGEGPVPEGLGMDQVAGRIAEYITQRVSSCKENDGPFAPIVGIFGRWGAGKTHLMNLLGRCLATSAPSFAICCFRAWKFEVEGDLGAAMVSALVDEGNYPWNAEFTVKHRFLPNGKQAKQIAGELGGLLLSFAAGAVPVWGNIALQATKVLSRAQKAGEPGTWVDGEQALPRIAQVGAKMRELVNDNIVPDPDSHLVVLVDDLDRCSPPNLVRLFEWFKNHLDTPRCVYVVGLDHRMAARAIAGHYRDYVRTESDEGIDYGYRYLDKLLEMQFEIQPSRMTESMAMQHLGIRGGDARDIAAWTRWKLRKDYPGEPEVRRLLGETPALWVPRLMIRSLRTYQMALDALLEQDAVEPSLLTNDLCPQFPFWLMWLSVLHHTFTPDSVERFLRVYPERRNASEDALQPFGPLSETDYREELVRFIEASRLECPSRQQLAFLYRIVREKTPLSLRNPKR